MGKNATKRMVVARAKPAAKGPARRQARAAMKTAVVLKRAAALAPGAKPPLPAQRFTVSHLREEDFKHSVRDYSDDVELLEIILPSDFETVTQRPASGSPPSRPDPCTHAIDVVRLWTEAGDSSRLTGPSP